MARMSQSASSCGLASWMRPQQLRHFYGSKCLFAKIAIPYTIYLSLDLPEFYVWQSISMSNDRCARMWSGHLFAEIAIPCTIYLSLSSLGSMYVWANQYRSAYYSLGCAFLQYTTYYIYDAYSSLLFHKKFKNPYTVDEYSQKLNERKILTVLRRNSIIIVNCSTEYI